MSVIKAILFYSKRNQKSYRMKRVIDDVGADIEAISVDSLEVRERLMEDEKFGIDQVPAVLVLYSSGQHKTYTNKGLDDWFDQLLQNIKQYQMQQQQMMMAASQPPEPEPEPVYTQIDEGVPKPLRRKPGSTSDIPSGLPSPGRPQRTGGGGDGNVTTLIEDPPEEIGPGGIGGGGSGMTGGKQVPGVGGISSAQAAMISEHIKDAEPLIPITSDPNIQTGRKEVKSSGLSAAELAKQMAEQREQYEEKLEENRPFI